MKYLLFITLAALGLQPLSAQTAAGSTSTNKPAIQLKEVDYADGTMPCQGYIAYDPAIKTPRPAILILPEWWGVNEYPRQRAVMLAKLGYVAMVVDLYGRGKVVNTPGDATEASGNFYKDPSIARSRVNAALARLKTFPGVDPKNIGLIGYCFGGAMALDLARMGEDFRGTVSFHAGLTGVDAIKGKVKSKILVCQGGSDKFVTAAEIKAFRKNLDTTGVSYIFKTYDDAQHAFTNPAATETGKKFNLPIAYNEKADKESWEEMKKFFADVFAERKPGKEKAGGSKDPKATGK
ncbi:MAG: dienelactone hydrolase family protein [Bacteroidetes bacterium]|nr:dienelactone hydrolase family protein [Bacteroidota bacterium]